MICDSIQEQISDLLDHELSPEHAQPVFLHLGNCRECAEFYAHGAALKQRLRREAAAVFPPALDARMRTALDARSGREQRARAIMPDRLRVFLHRRIVLPVPVAVAVLIMSLGLGMFLLRSFAPSLLPVEKETRIVVAYPAVEVVPEQPMTN